MVHNHKIMAVSSLLLDTQSESFVLKWPLHGGYKYKIKVVADCGHHEEVALTKCIEYPRELEKVVIGKEVNISKGFSYYKNTKLKRR